MGLRKPLYLLRRRWKLRQLEQADEPLEVDGVPMPPPKLRFLVGDYRYPSFHAFLKSGKRTAAAIQDQLQSSGISLSGAAMLDFGCGCGRVARHWATLTDVEVHGTDYNEMLVKWCQENLRFMETRQNELEPPLSYRDGRFDFIYSISIFTHLPIDLQHAWVEELRRVLRPGGALMITVLGKSFADRELEGDESAAFNAGRPVVLREKLAGTNACASFAPHSWVVGSLLKGFEVVAFQPHEQGKAFGHEMYLAIKR